MNRLLQNLPESTRRILLTCSVMLAAIIQVLDTTIANVAMPHMQGSLSANQDQIAWVLTSYIVAAAITMPMTGFIAGKFGRKRLMLWSVLGFTVASGLCGAAQTLTQMVLLRMLQGMFGACLVPLSQSVLLDTFPVAKHAKAMAIWGVGVMVAPILGPTLGGWLTEYYSWRWVFYINLPFGILAFVGISALVVESPLDRERRFDVFGFFLFSISIGALQLMLDRGQSQYWFESLEIVSLLVICCLFMYLFVVHMFTCPRPFIEPALFRDRNFVLSLVFIFMVGIILLATLALLPPYLQSLLGYPVLDAGLILAPRGAGTMLAMMFSSPLMARFSARTIIMLGLFCIAASLWYMTGFSLDTDGVAIGWTGFVQGLGLGLVFVPLSTVAFVTLNPVLRTEAASIFSLVRNIGSSVGISIVVSQLADNTQFYHEVIGESLTLFNQALSVPSVVQVLNTQTQQGLASLNGELTRQAAQMAYIADFRLIMWMALAAIPLALLLRSPEAGAVAPVEAVID